MVFAQVVFEPSRGLLEMNKGGTGEDEVYDCGMYYTTNGNVLTFSQTNCRVIRL